MWMALVQKALCLTAGHPTNTQSRISVDTTPSPSHQSVPAALLVCPSPVPLAFRLDVDSPSFDYHIDAQCIATALLFLPHAVARELLIQIQIASQSVGRMMGLRASEGIGDEEGLRRGKWNWSSSFVANLRGISSSKGREV